MKVGVTVHSYRIFDIKSRLVLQKRVYSYCSQRQLVIGNWPVANSLAVLETDHSISWGGGGVRSGRKCNLVQGRTKQWN